MIKNRTDIKDFILQIERDFPVNDWKINGIHLWPILRIRLFFYLISTIENKQKTAVVHKNKTLLHKIKGKLKSYTNIFYYFYWKSKLPTKDYVFVGSDSHRVNYKASRFNRYFDTLIQRDNTSSQSMYLEYASDLDNQYEKHLVYKHNNALKGFLSLKKAVKVSSYDFEGYTGFLEMLKGNPLLIKFAQDNKESKLLLWYKNRFGVKILFFKTILKIIKPKQVAVLCYYSEDLFALIASSNKLGISTIDMQHGPQTDIHLSYGSWSCIPDQGYDVLPRTFWCWDAYSKEVLEKWASKDSLYSAIVIGNPWVDYWKSKSTTYKHKDFVLYSLQPSPITLEQTFTPQIIQSIKEAQYKWFIRLHPRQLNQMSKIKELLKAKGIFDLVNIDEATNDPLPELLANAKIHITHSSGSALEADFFNLKTVLINKIGLTSFPHLIESKAAQYIDYSDESFNLKFNQILQDV